MIEYSIYLYIGLIVGAYLLGSIPTSVWIGKLFYGIDVRAHGSGNAGATNTVRVLGPKAGVPVLVFDAFKGWLAVYLSYLLPLSFFSTPTGLIHFQLMLGFAALLGHVFPIYIGFKGGKGIATLLGIVIALYPDVTLVALGVFIVTFALSHYISLSSMMAAITFPFFVIFVFDYQALALIIFSVLIALFVPFTHKKNIKRLLAKEEPKFTLKKKEYISKS